MRGSCKARADRRVGPSVSVRKHLRCRGTTLKPTDWTLLWEIGRKPLPEQHYSGESAPAARRRTRSQRAAKAWLWVTRTAARPCSRASESRRVKMCSAVASSRSPVGSSARRSLGWVTRARARATRCCSPPESSPERWWARPCRPTRLEPGTGGGQGRFAGLAAGEQRQRYVFQGGELGQQVVELPEVADRAVAEGGGLGGGEASDVGVAAPDFAGGRLVERGEQVEQRAFAGAGYADDGDDLAGGDGEVEVVEESEAGRAGGERRIGFREGGSAEDRSGHRQSSETLPPSSSMAD